MTNLADQVTGYWGGLPQAWTLVPLKYGFGLIGSGTTPATNQLEYFDGSIAWVNTSELRENIITTTEKTVTELALQQYSALRVYPPGTVLVAMYGATIGRVGILNTSACVNQAVCALADPIMFDSRFVAYALQSSRDYLLSLASGGGQPNLSLEKVINHEIPTPSLAQQRAIADYLDHKTVEIDELLTAKQELLTLLAEKRSALITHAVTRGLAEDVPLHDSGVEWLGQVPAHWEVVALKRVADVRSGATKGRRLDKNEAVSVPYMRVANVQDGYIDLSDVAEIEVLPEEIPRYSLKKGDVLMTEGGDADKLGRGAVWDGSIDPCLHQNHVFAVRCFGVAPEWLSLVTSSESAKAYFEAASKQSTNLASISVTNLQELPVPLPPKTEQESILSQLWVQMSALEDLHTATLETLSLLQERRTALIAAAVTGQIEVSPS